MRNSLLNEFYQTIWHIFRPFMMLESFSMCYNISSKISLLTFSTFPMRWSICAIMIYYINSFDHPLAYLFSFFKYLVTYFAITNQPQKVRFHVIHLWTHHSTNPCRCFAQWCSRLKTIRSPWTCPWTYFCPTGTHKRFMANLAPIISVIAVVRIALNRTKPAGIRCT